MAVVSGAVVSAVVIAGAVVSAYASYSSGQSQKAMGNYNARLAENQAKYNAQIAEETAAYNQKIAEQEALAKEQQSHSDTEMMRKEKDRLLASQRAAYAKSGATMNEGTSLLVMAESVKNIELDILNVQRARAIEASSLRAQGQFAGYAGQAEAIKQRYTGSATANASRYEGKMAGRAGNIGATSTVLSGTGSAGLGVLGAKK